VILEDQATKPALRKAIAEVRADIEGGSSLSGAMAKQEKVFPPLMCAMILAGETSIRDVIPFPKTARGTDLMCEAPSPVPEKNLRELGIKLR